MQRPLEDPSAVIAAAIFGTLLRTNGIPMAFSQRGVHLDLLSPNAVQVVDDWKQRGAGGG